MTESQATAKQSWNPDSYRRTAGFVADLGRPLLTLLAPQPHEAILDLGCGDGALTKLLADHCDRVVGVDFSAEQVAGAQGLGLDARVADGHALDFDEEFHAVLSNAALHWMLDPDAAIDSVWRALKPGGRFVGEKGGGHNVAQIKAALLAGLEERGLDTEDAVPWYFATIGDYRARLEARGFQVERMILFERPTPLPTVLHDWLFTFGESFIKQVPESERKTYLDGVAESLRPHLCDAAGNWYADYVRLRFVAHKPE